VGLQVAQRAVEVGVGAAEEHDRVEEVGEVLLQFCVAEAGLSEAGGPLRVIGEGGEDGGEVGLHVVEWGLDYTVFGGRGGGEKGSRHELEGVGGGSVCCLGLPEQLMNWNEFFTFEKVLNHFLCQWFELRGEGIGSVEGGRWSGG
jgi:hypothetical protein